MPALSTGNRTARGRVRTTGGRVLRAFLLLAAALAAGEAVALAYYLDRWLTLPLP